MSSALKVTVFFTCLSAFLWPCGTDAFAEAPALQFPVDCTPGGDCFIESFVDVDIREGSVADYRCSGLADDGSNGIRITFRSLKEKHRVFAAADGVAALVLDGGSGGNTPAGACGNGVLLVHEGGWETRYCHLLAGSATVKPGQFVTSGQVLGVAGDSGQTDWPALHFDLRNGNEFFDPFTGRSQSVGCGLGGRPLWQDGKAIDYLPFAVMDSGFAAGVPSEEALKKGVARLVEIPGSVGELVFWGHLTGVTKGDMVTLAVYDPFGTEFMSLNGMIEDSRKRRIAFVKRPLEKGNWSPGIYKGSITISRPGIPPVIRTTSVELRY